LTGGPGARQLSAIRNLDQDPFDRLAAVLFEPDFAVYRAALIPLAVVKARSRRSVHTNSHVFHLRDEVWAEHAVVDVTAEIRKAASGL